VETLQIILLIKVLFTLVSIQLIHRIQREFHMLLFIICMDLFSIKLYGIHCSQTTQRDLIFIQNQLGQEVDFMGDHGPNH